MSLEGNWEPVAFCPNTRRVAAGILSHGGSVNSAEGVQIQRLAEAAAADGLIVHNGESSPQQIKGLLRGLKFVVRGDNTGRVDAGDVNVLQLTA